MLYEIVKEAADRKGVTIQRVEIECNLPNGSIGKWRTAKPSWDKVLRVAKYLRIPVTVLREAAAKEVTNA